MAERGRGAGESDGAASAVSERLLFADFSAARPVNFPPAVRDDARALAPDTPEIPQRFERRAIAGMAAQLTGLSPSAVRRSAVAAAGLESDRGIAFLLVPVFMAAGVIGYFSLAAEPGFFQPIAIVFLTACGAILSRARPRTHLCFMAALLCFLGVLAAKVETWRMSTRVLGSEISTRLSGRVVSLDRMPNGRVRFTIDVISTARPALRYAPHRVRISARSVPAGVVAGAEVGGFVRLLPPAGPVRPDSYDFSFESYFDGIGASGFFLTNPELQPSHPMPFTARLSSGIENARENIAGHVRDSIGGAEGEIAAALIVGVRAGIPDEINEAMRRTGIYHIISISGLHMALVAGTIMAMLRGAFALFPDFSSRRPVKKYAAAAALVSIAAYLFFSGLAVAAERSFIMLAVMLVAVLFDRAALTMRNLAISAIAVIVVSPHEVVGPSFQMSFAATAALVGAYAGWTDYRAMRIQALPPRRSAAGFLMRKVLVAMVGLAMTSIVAGSATALFAMWHFQRVSPLSLFANLAVMPIVSVVVMPFAVLSALTMPFGADGPFLYVMGKGLTAMIAISGWMSARSPIDAVGLVPLQSVLFVTVALVIATMATTWLRLASIPFALAGLLTIPNVSTPDVLVSEDGRLIALPVGEGRLAVSRPRPNEFTMDNWKRALEAETIVLPVTVKARDAGLAKEAGTQIGTKQGADSPIERQAKIVEAPDTHPAKARHLKFVNPEDADPASPPDAQIAKTRGLKSNAATVGEREVGEIEGTAIAGRADLPPGSPFRCAAGLCLARHPSGAIVAQAENAASARPACAFAALIVIDEATAANPCHDGRVTVVTKRQLARAGSAAIYFDQRPEMADPASARSEAAQASSVAGSATIRFAVEQPYRPWHVQRKYSREARGLPPYQKKQRQQSQSIGDQSSPGQ